MIITGLVSEAILVEGMLFYIESCLKRECVLSESYMRGWILLGIFSWGYLLVNCKNI